MGVGPKEQSNKAKDGIEALLGDYGLRRTRQVYGMEETGYWIAAIAE